MFWNSATTETSRAASRSSISITHRLTVTYTLITFALLAVTISALYYALLKSLEEEDTLFLKEKAERLQAVFDRDTIDRKMVETEIHNGSDLQFVKYYIHVLDSAGRIYAQTSSTGESPPLTIFEGIATDQGKQPVIIKKMLSSDRAYLLLSTRAGRDSRYLIQAALDVSREAGIVRRYRFMAEGILLISIFISAAAGMVLARRAMRPLARITSVIQRIRATQMTARVNPDQWPQELTVLATSFDDMLDRLQDAFSRLSHYSADLAHELRTPINNLIGEAEVMLAKPRTPLQYQQNIESSLEEFTRLGHMIDSLLFLAKAESTDIKVAPVLLDGAAEARAVADYFDELFQENNISLSIRGNAALHADPLLFRRALSNILSNALRYSADNGTVAISIEHDAHNNAVFTVSDTGIGIHPDDIPNIFNRFFRAESARTLDAAGSGLGLAIVKSIMDLHGGTIDITSEPSQGTSVTLLFPHAA
jgi:two-component system, OmpR family, heavy metal sensor histidine kinase CusS